eukprot:TRINITY_DN602_c0_g1_i9.p1 TRINITY_DN602_c0_g1~~TRINITY_DN602_c0_g1_i9.p1  ORF type:complete len:310 (-),score=76.02 TRINITY_DN602_c0_g1_i9:293-1222(-)
MDGTHFIAMACGDAEDDSQDEERTCGYPLHLRGLDDSLAMLVCHCQQRSIARVSVVDGGFKQCHDVSISTLLNHQPLRCSACRNHHRSRSSNRLKQLKIGGKRAFSIAMKALKNNTPKEYEEKIDETHKIDESCSTPESIKSEKKKKKKASENDGILVLDNPLTSWRHSVPSWAAWLDGCSWMDLLEGNVESGDFIDNEIDNDKKVIPCERVQLEGDLSARFLILLPEGLCECRRSTKTEMRLLKYSPWEALIKVTSRKRLPQLLLFHFQDFPEQPKSTIGFLVDSKYHPTIMEVVRKNCSSSSPTNNK